MADLRTSYSLGLSPVDAFDALVDELRLSLGRSGLRLEAGPGGRILDGPHEVGRVGAETMRTRFCAVTVAFLLAATAVLVGGQASPYEKSLEIRVSRIPHAGNGVFTKVAIPKDAYLGAYAGELITEDEYLRRAGEDKWQYMMGLLDCVKPHTGGLTVIDGIRGNVFTRMNYAPPEFQNVKFEKICDPPFVRIVALRDIAAGEELWVDYGPRYRYDFMQDPAVIRFFDDLRAQRARKDPGGR